MLTCNRMDKVFDHFCSKYIEQLTKLSNLAKIENEKGDSHEKDNEIFHFNLDCNYELFFD